MVPRGLLSKPFDSAVSNPTGMLRKVALERCGGGYREEFSQSAVEDFELWNRILEIGEIHNLNERLVKYRIHPDQLSQANPDSNLFFRRLAIMNALLGKYGSKQKSNFDPEGKSLKQLSSQISHIRPTIFSVPGRIRFFLFKCVIKAEDSLRFERKLKAERGSDVEANLSLLQRFWLVARHPIAFIVWATYNPSRRPPLGFTDCRDCEGHKAVFESPPV
jgi:hypothetical protein